MIPYPFSSEFLNQGKPRASGDDPAAGKVSGREVT